MARIQSIESKIERRPTDEFPGYATSDEGQRVWSRWKNNGRKCATLGDVWHELKQCPSTDGYLFVTLCKNGKAHTFYLHRLVAIEKYGPIPKGMEVRHLDGNKLNNDPSNLRIGTHAENMADKVRHGTQAKGERNGSAKLTEAKVRRIRALYATGKWTYRALAVKFGVHRETIGQIVRGEIWTHLL